jgi:hypothetical protein
MATKKDRKERNRKKLQKGKKLEATKPLSLGGRSTVLASTQLGSGGS